MSYRLPFFCFFTRYNTLTMKANIYLVPHDFTPVADTATRMALEFAHIQNGTLVLIHVVDKKSDRRAAKEKFAEVLNQYSESDRAIIRTVVIEGDVYGDIGKASEVLNASLIVMGTHGSSGLQKIFGSRALKVVNSTGTPFMITQGTGNLNEIKHIVMPFYFEKETVQIATFAADIAKMFNSPIHLVGFYDKDEWLQGKTKSNQLVLRRYFTEQGIEHEIVNLPKEKSYEKELQEYAASINADLFAVAHYSESILTSASSFVQELIENAHDIPVLTVNTEELTITSGLSFLTI